MDAKPHRASIHGPKAKAKKERKMDPTSKGGHTGKQKNVKAFSIQNVNKAGKNFRFAQDSKTKKHHVPIINRAENPDQPPPLVIAVSGPPNSGKSTLIRCLVKAYARQTLKEINGPITVLAGKERRLTFLEVNNDINGKVYQRKILLYLSILKSRILNYCKDVGSRVLYQRDKFRKDFLQRVHQNLLH